MALDVRRRHDHALRGRAVAGVDNRVAARVHDLDVPRPLVLVQAVAEVGAVHPAYVVAQVVPVLDQELLAARHAAHVAPQTHIMKRLRKRAPLRVRVALPGELGRVDLAPAREDLHAPAFAAERLRGEVRLGGEPIVAEQHELARAKDADLV